MFEEHIFQVFIVVAYFYELTPYLFEDFKKKEWITCDPFESFDETLASMSVFILFLFVSFVLFQRVALFLYGKFIWLCEEEFLRKRKDKLRLKKELLQMTVDLKVRENKNLDVPDGKKKKKLGLKPKLLPQ